VGFRVKEKQSGLTFIEMMICAMAAIGFAFDIYELLMLPVVLKPALAELGGVTAEGTLVYAPGSPAYAAWARTLFFLPALVGGIFGLLGGYLTDLFGRRRVLTWSILLYAGSAMASGFVTTVEQLLVLRCLVFTGVCVEFVAAVAWLAEVFEDRKTRERALGYTQAFSSVGGFLVGLVFWIISQISTTLPAIYGAHEPWRYMLISGVIPALPLIVIRPFLPESPRWLEKKRAGTLKRPSFLELFRPKLVRTTVVTTLMFAASYGMAFGAIQQLAQILPRHAAVQQQMEDAVVEAREASESGITPQMEGAVRASARDEAVAAVTIWQEIGGLLGRILLALLVLRIVSRRALLRVFQIPALIFVPLLFYWISKSLDEPGTLIGVQLGIFVAGLLVVAQFSFWGNYIPRVFPLHLRGTGESFAANIGGRILGTAAAWLTLTFAASTPPDPARIALVGGIVAGAYCLVGVICSFFLPEPPAENVDAAD
jgi:MFS family permease